MRLYSGTSKQFIDDSVQNQIADKLKTSFFQYFRFYPCTSEVASWRNSLRALSQTFQYANLDDHGVILEYQLPLTSKRLDCLICGRDEKKRDNAIIVELKQWEQCEHADGERVLTWVGGGKREVLHPSVQVGQYKMYLEDTHTAFYEDISPVHLRACSYLHNYPRNKEDIIFGDQFSEYLNEYPVFTADDVDIFRDFLQMQLSGGDGIDVLNRIETSKYRPSKKLMQYVGGIIKGKSEYILLDEQLIVYDKVISSAKKGFHDKQKKVIIIRGGPGTGKSVIAINLMADLLLKNYNAHYATGSRSFTQTLRKIIGTRGSTQFKYFNSYGQAEDCAVDVLIADEAHRIRKTSNNRFTRREKRSNLPQIEELIRAAKVSVFFIDDDQVVRPNEIGSVEYLKKAALDSNCKVCEYELEAQFRCNGSDAFVNWINNTLTIRRTANVIWDQHEEFDFKICSSPIQLENAIRKKVKQGFTGRVAAGFCWPWSMPNSDGTLKNDVVIGDYCRPWDAKPEAKKLAKGIPPAHFWAYDPNGLDQIGCIYTAQGFEFDYIGVIFGEDLVYDFDNQTWLGDKSKSADSVVKRSKQNFVDFVKNSYRVLLSRGMKGCYVYFINKDTERFFKTRIEGSVDYKEEEIIETIGVEKITEKVEDRKKYVEYLPVYSLEAAAGAFSEGQEVSEVGWIKPVGIGRKLNRWMFVVKVVGKSMEPKIPDGSYCVFSAGAMGTRVNKIVLVQHNSILDSDTGGKYTVKKYTSSKKHNADGTWEHEEITLLPLNQDYEPIVISNPEEEEFKVIAELVAVLGG